MISSRTLALLCAFGVLFEARAEATPRDPTGKWVVDYADARCYLSREYGRVDNPFTLVFEPEIMGDGGELELLHSDKSEKVVNGPVTIRTENGRTVRTEL